MWVGAVVVISALAACGRIGFDGTTTSDGTTSGDGGLDPDAVQGTPFMVELPPESAIMDLAVTDDGGVIAVGARIGDLSIDGVVAPGIAAIDAVLVSIDAIGRVRWMHQRGGTENDHADAVAVAPDGSIYVGGYVENTASLGGPSRAGMGRDAFVAKYTRDGDWIWNVGFGGNETSADFGDAIADIALAPDGDIVVVGQVTGVVDFGGGAMAGTGADSEAFVARYSPAGVFRWARRFGNAGTNAFTGVVATSTAIYVGGFYSGTPNFGTGVLPGRGGNDAVMMRITADGTNVEWLSNFGGADNQRIYNVGLVNGALVGAGYYWETVDLPGVPTSAGRADGIVVTFGDPGGAFVRAVRYGNAGCDFLTSLHIGGDDAIAAGTFAGTVQLDGAVSSSGATDSIAFGVQASTFAWHRTFGNDTDEINNAAAGSLATGLYVGGMRDVRFDNGCYHIVGQISGYVRRF